MSNPVAVAPESVAKFEVVYACDDNYAALTAISAVSLLLKTAGVRVTLLGYRLKPESVELVRSRVLRFGGEFRHFDVSELVGELSRRGLCPYTSYAAYSRLFIERLFTGEEGRVVYLDCDTLVLAPLNELFALPLGGKPFAFGYDAIAPAYRRFVGLEPEQPYFNSGVMLADLAVWRSSGAAARLERELKSPSGPNPLGDQDLIVRAWNDLIAPLAPKWNCLSQYFLFDYAGMRRLVGREAPWATAAEYAEACAAPAIAHFSGHTLGRPWFTGSRHPLRARYREVAALAELAAVAEQPGAMRFPYRVQYLLRRLLPQRVFNRVAKGMYDYNLRRMYGG